MAAITTSKTLIYVGCVIEPGVQRRRGLVAPILIGVAPRLELMRGPRSDERSYYRDPTDTDALHDWVGHGVLLRRINPDRAAATDSTMQRQTCPTIARESGCRAGKPDGLPAESFDFQNALLISSLWSAFLS